MYRWEKTLRELEKSRKNPKSPSFSSTLLDEIYRSIDGNHEKGAAEELTVYGKKSVNNDNDKYMSINYGRSGNNGGSAGVVLRRTEVEKEEVAESLKTRASLIEKWMDKKAINGADKVCSRRSRRPCSSSLPEIDNSYIMKPSSSSLLIQDNDPLFFSSSSISSDSSSGGLSSSSSDTEFFSSSSTSSSSSSLTSNKKASRKSCFTSSGASPWPKPVRTSISRRQQQEEEEEAGYEFNTADDHQNNRQKTKDQETLIKSKNRAMKIYSNLKNVKQPISPGARLTSFINSLFTNGNAKKKFNINTNSEKGRVYEEDQQSGRKLKSTNQTSSTTTTTYSYSSSLSRSCLSKTPPPPQPPTPPPQPSEEKKLSTNSPSTGTSTKRTVRFYPVSVIVDEDCRPCGHKCIIFDAEENIKLEQKPDQIQNSSKNNRELGTTTFTVKRIISHPEEEEEEDEDEDNYDDDFSDSSSDLFEIDHLSLFTNINTNNTTINTTTTTTTTNNNNNNRFLEELPVYETTHLDRNHAIASGLIR